MKSISIDGVFEKNGRLFTQNINGCKGIKVHNEKLITYKNKEFRSWNPYRSKLAAAIINGLKNLKIGSDSKILYLGAATGTTVSHISDIAKDGTVYAVESSPVAVKKLLQLSEKRQNIMPILSDANHPDRYSAIVPTADIVYQDISQRNQSEIFIGNLLRYLKKDGQGIIMVKARSIDVSLKPKQAYKIATKNLEEHGINITNLIDISRYEKDHAAIVTSN